MPAQARLRAARRAIAHDLRNVFQSIRLAADLLRRFPDEERRTPLLETVAASVERGRDLLSELMLAARGDETPGRPGEWGGKLTGVRRAGSVGDGRLGLAVADASGSFRGADLIQ